MSAEKETERGKGVDRKTKTTLRNRGICLSFLRPPAAAHGDRLLSPCVWLCTVSLNPSLASPMSTPLYSGRLASSTRAAPRAPLSSLHASLSDSAYSDGLGAPSLSSRGGGVGHQPGPASRSQQSSPAHRHTIVALCAAATAVAYIERVGFAIAYAAAADAAAAGGARADASTGAVLSAFYWGYALSQIPGGWAAARWGGSSVLTASFALWSVATLLTPLSAGPRARAATATGRVAVGVAQGALIPAMHTVLSQVRWEREKECVGVVGRGQQRTKAFSHHRHNSPSSSQWIPPHERARATSAATSGMYAGAAAASLLMPRLVAAAGPSSAPRLAGGLGLAWLAAWRLTGGGDAPWHGQSPLPTSGGGGSTQTRRKSTPTPPPWRRMLASPAVWAITVCNFAFHYAFYVVMNWMPSYFERVLGAPLAKSRGGGRPPLRPHVRRRQCGGGGGGRADAGRRAARGVGAQSGQQCG